MKKMTRKDEINCDLNGRSHFVLLGAGASRAALPNGDKHGRGVPLLREVADAMDLATNFPDDLRSLARSDFEAAYSELADRGEDTSVVDEKVRSFFASLELPDEANLYDVLQLSLRPKDLVFTFNWDPLLVQSRLRLLQRGVLNERLPRLHFLHGNTMIGSCDEHARMGLIGRPCGECGRTFKPSQLLYPVKQKKYQDGGFIEAEWATARKALQASSIFTIFGYSAPVTDVEAIDLLKDAWGDVETNRATDQVETINRPGADHDALRATWDSFIHTHHYDIFERFEDSWIAQHPRRTMEAFVHQYVEAQFIERNPVPTALSALDKLIAWFDELFEAEDRFVARSAP
jgi:hypothetical protein